MPDALLWDNDGILVDTERLYFQATREVLATVGVPLTEPDYRQLFLVEARGAWHLAEARVGGGAALEALKRERGRRYAALLEASELLIPGAASAVQRLARRHRMAIVTSSERDHFERIHRKTGLLPHFELVLTRGDYAECKPHPEPYLTAAARLGLAPARCLAIEDSERGLRAAKAAGVPCWVVPSDLTRGSRFAEADAVFDDLGQIADRLLGA
jgi:HAD superfamily hydrolase (TIGR01509 family)